MEKILRREREDYVTQLYAQSSAISFLSAGSYNHSELVALRLAEMTAWATRKSEIDMYPCYGCRMRPKQSRHCRILNHKHLISPLCSTKAINSLPFCCRAATSRLLASSGGVAHPWHVIANKKSMLPYTST